jgi:hypothetical protein
MRIKINWMEKLGNHPRINLTDCTVPDDGGRVYERRGNGLHRRDHDDGWVRYFYTDGQPCGGFGGATFSGTLTTGEHFEYRGAWSSRAACINALWPEDPIVDVDCGYMATAVTVRKLLMAWAEQMTSVWAPDFGFAVVLDGDHGPILQPTRNGKLKMKAPYEEIVHHADPMKVEEAVRAFALRP